LDSRSPTDLDVEPDARRFFAADLLAGQVIVVTGGGTGLGYAAALALGQVGARVELAGRDAEQLALAASRLRERGISCAFASLDIRDQPAVDAFFERVVAENGRFDGLVNNAGGQFTSPAEELTPNGWRSVVDLNLNGTWWCTSAAGRQMIALQNGGRILNLVVSFADRSAAGMVHSGAARAGVVHMTRTLAREWAQFGISVNAIGPQATTDAVRRLYGPAGIANVENSTPAGRWGTPEEIALWVVALTSPMATYLTGAFIPIDGGNAAGTGLNFRNGSTR
jgi:NAD(P)-dependent dehydrogenase (short-subunit alcohol dehydrogenase family)